MECWLFLKNLKKTQLKLSKQQKCFFHLISSKGNGKFPSEFYFCWIAENNYDTIIAIIFWLFVLNVPDFEMSTLPTFFIYFHIILTL